MPTLDELRARLDELPQLERDRFRRRIDAAGTIKDPNRRSGTLERLGDEMADAFDRYRLRAASRPKQISYPKELPITDRRDELLAAIRDHQVVIVAGETGSGKSTQLPKLCLELGRGVEGLIAHTQPRRLAARTIAERVAHELGSSVGATVGFAVRFTDRVGDGTMVKLMTDGLLLAEIQRDKLLSRYDTIIVDEAHERSLNVDFLLGYLHQLLPKRPDLKLIITSATIDTERFAAHFAGPDGTAAPVIEVSGRTYPVEVRYRPLDDGDEPEPRDQPAGIADAVSELFRETDGDILVFCAGERDIRDAADAIQALHLRHTEVLPLYARLPAAEQHRVFAPATGRRVVVATNVAETSLTVPGVRSVVDAGTARVSRYSRRTKVQRLPIEPISQASANQRAGRCGRLGPGIAIRLYSQDDYDARPEYTEPEILRTSLASVILQMAAIGLGDAASFPFIDSPDLRSIRDGVQLLDELGAIDAEAEGTPGWLTSTGRKLARFPLDPRIGRMVLEGSENLCVREVLIIAAALSVQDPRERPSGQETQADQNHARFAVEGSDFLGWLALWEYLQQEQKARTGNQFRRMCRSEHLNYLRIREWMGVHAQLRQTADELDLRFNKKKADAESIHRTVLAGLLSHVGHKDPNSFEYRGARSATFAIQPGSVLFRKAPEWIVAAELVETSRLWARGIASIDPTWLEEVGAHLVRRTHADPWWDEERAAAVTAETVTLYGLTIASDRTVQVARFDPAAARELFIRHALVEGEWDRRHAFVTHNRRQFADVMETEARGRLGDILVDDDVLVAWFDERIPGEIVSAVEFDRWWRDQRPKTPTLLDLDPDVLIDPGAASVDDDAYPEVWTVGDLTLPLTYEFDPTSPTDGVTVHLDVGLLYRIDPGMFEWQVPGFREELVTELIRSMSKQERKQFVPIPETVSRVITDLQGQEGRFVDALRRSLSAMSGAPILPDAFSWDGLPNHLRPHYVVEDGAGNTLASGRDLASLRAGLREQTREAVEHTPHALERSGIAEWDMGTIDPVVEIDGAGATLSAYPALVDNNDSVALRLLATPDEQAEAMWAGCRRLLRLTLPVKYRAPKTVLTDEATLAVAGGPHATVEAWREDCVVAAYDEVIAAAGGPAWDAASFAALQSAARAQLGGYLEAAAGRSIEVLQNHRRVMAGLESLVGARFDLMVDDVVDQIGRLVHTEFIAQLGVERLTDVARYLRAIEHRVERVRDNLDRDAAGQRRVQALEAEHDRVVDVLGWTPELIEVAWQLQEFRVSVFAQSVGVKGSVSEKRIRSALTAASG